MAMTDKERKRRQRDREKEMGVKPFAMDLTEVERHSVQKAASRQGYDDQTEYLLSLVYADLKKPASRACNYPDCHCPFDKPPEAECYRGYEEPGKPVDLHTEIREAFQADQEADDQARPAKYPYRLVRGQMEKVEREA